MKKYVSPMAEWITVLHTDAIATSFVFQEGESGEKLVGVQTSWLLNRR